jgi:hypothetical protein
MSLRAHIIGLMASAALSGGVADAYAVEGFSPPVVADFANEYYRVGGSDSDFDSMFTYTSGDALSTMIDSDGLLKWCPHNLLPENRNFADGVEWDLINVATPTKDTVGPYGDANTAWTVVDNSAGGTGLPSIKQTLSSVSGKRTFWAVVKADGADYVCLRIQNQNAFFDLSDGSVSGETMNGDVTITPIGTEAGWYLCKAEHEGSQFNYYIYPNDNGSSYTSNLDGTTSIKVYASGIYDSSFAMVDNPDATDIGLEFEVPTTTAAKYLARRGNHVYNGSSWVNKGLLLETEARTNLIPDSNSTTGWTAQNNATLTANQTAGPDGNTSLAEVKATATTSSRVRVAEAYSGNTDAKTTFSLVLKAGDYQYIGVRAFATTSQWAVVVFDASNGTVTQSSVGGSVTIQSSGVINLGGGLFRCWFTATPNSGGAFVSFLAQAQSSGTPTLGAAFGDETFSQTANDNFYMGFLQAEEASTVSSYIPTSGATVTRPAQALSIASANVSYSAGGVSWQVKGTMTYADTGQSREVSICQWGSGADELNMQVSAASSRTGQFRTLGRTSAEGAYASDSANTLYSPGVNVEFNAALRHSASELNAAQDGTSLTASTVPNSVPNVSGQDFDFGVTDSISTDTPLNITLFRQFDADITDTGIETASAA